MVTRWLVEPGNPEQERELARALHVSSLLARILVNRGARTAATARQFLDARLSDLEDPAEIPGMEAATERLGQAVRERERVLIFGDYDVDGLCSSALLTKLLRRFGLAPSHYIPHRIQEGYGLNRAALAGITDTDLVVTVDCGMDAWLYRDVIEQASYDLVVVDHHEPAGPAIPALAVVNPKLERERTGFPDLAGVGVTFKLAWALARELSADLRAEPDVDALFADLVALAALGTVADVVPLLGENRILTRQGLEALAHTAIPGLQALLADAGLTGRRLRADDIAFRLGPRLNAAGRMGEADLALQLLITDSPASAREISARLEAHNAARRQLQEVIEREALAQLQGEEDLVGRRVLVIGGEDWSPGVIGIVAGRLTDRFHRPAAVVAMEGDKARGSVRSIPGFHILDALRACGDCLIEFGGHAHAAGFTLARERLGELEQRLNDYARQLPEELWQPALPVDAEVALSHLNRGVVTELERLEPLGEENPDPVLVSHGVAVAGEIRRLGSRGKHLSFYARQGNSSARVIGFNLGERATELARLGGLCSLAYTPRLNAFEGAEPTVELELRDFRPYAPASGSQPSRLGTRAPGRGPSPEGSRGPEGG